LDNSTSLVTLHEKTFSPILLDNTQNSALIKLNFNQLSFQNSLLIKSWFQNNLSYLQKKADDNKLNKC